MKESLGGSIQSLFTLLIHHGCEGNFNPSHLDYLMENGPIYYNNKPQGLMLFGIASESDLPHSWFTNIKTTSNKMDYNALLNASDFNLLEQKELFGPSTFDEFKMMLSTYKVIIGVLFGKKSFVYKQVKKMYNHAINNRHAYKETCTTTERL
jgi:hypothetical protein